ncbi:hypothetical protein CCMSSC00406_0006078 [Pleurotus cornucopiae]|uniref:Uncharacterized protein n=1 Tax=Pleurotus cornucopiae TaxID=5321 RepID=A0ACB7J866_PLECO|nr:hypothetical protein CCMSSC00406_0006078 [Pleurotus cornucopiae]
MEDIAIPEFYPKDAETQAIKLSSKELPNLRSLTLSVENSLLFDNLPLLDSLVFTSDRISSFVEPEFALRHLSEAFASIHILALHSAGTDTLTSLLSSLLNLQYISILDAPSSPSQAHDLGVILSKATNIKLKCIQFGDYDIAPFAQTLFGSMKHLVVIVWKSGESVWRLDRGSKAAIPTPVQDTYKNQWEPMLQAVEDYGEFARTVNVFV